jgi:hypothetical protein
VAARWAKAPSRPLCAGLVHEFGRLGRTEAPEQPLLPHLVIRRTTMCGGRCGAPMADNHAVLTLDPAKHTPRIIL